jgi:hypothetical protein
MLLDGQTRQETADTAFPKLRGTRVLVELDGLTHPAGAEHFRGAASVANPHDLDDSVEHFGRWLMQEQPRSRPKGLNGWEHIRNSVEKSSFNRD